MGRDQVRGSHWSRPLPQLYGFEGVNLHEKGGITTVMDTKLGMCKEGYLAVMKITEPRIGHAPFLSAMGLKVSV